MNALLPQRYFYALLLLLLTSAFSHLAHANQLPAVTGANYDGERISWDALPEAVGYNIFLEFQYLDTVTDSTSYIPSQTGEYRIGGFDNAGRYSPLEVIDRDVVPTTNVVEVEKLPGEGGDGEPPVNTEQLPPVTGAGFDGNVISWDALTGATGYNIYLDFDYVDTVVNDTAYTPTLSGEYRIAAFDDAGRFSPLQVIDANVVDTDNIVVVNLGNTEPPSTQPSSPQNARLTVYSSTAAELFWDRAPPIERVVSTEIFRDGQLLGTSPGTSFYDDTRTPDVQHSYELVAVSDNGLRSEPAFINKGPLIGNPDDVAESILAGISDAAGSNPHVQWFSTLRSFTLDTTPLELLSSESVTEDSLTIFRNIYQCDSGTLTRDEIESRFGIFRMNLDSCAFNGVSFFGDLAIVGTDIGGYNAEYDFLIVSVADNDAFVSGAVSLQIGRAQNFARLEYNEFAYSSIDPEAEDSGEDTFVVLNQVVTDSINSPERTTLETQIIVEAPWTSGQLLEVSTSEIFSGHGPDNGHYLSGELLVAAPSGNTMSIFADTGDELAWDAIINTGDGSTSTSGLWTEDNRLPCISVTRGDEALIGCTALF